MKSYILILGTLACAGCSHNLASPATPVEEVKYTENGGPPAPPPPLPPPAFTSTLPSTMHVLVDNQSPEPVQCGEMSVHVGKLDVNMPNGGSFQIAGVKGETKAYHILLQDVSFTHKETCLR